MRMDRIDAKMKMVGLLPLKVYLLRPGPGVQSIFSLRISLRGQLVKCFMTLLPNSLIFLLKN